MQIIKDEAHQLYYSICLVETCDCMGMVLSHLVNRTECLYVLAVFVSLYV